MVVMGKHLNNVTELIQKVPRKVDIWCKTKGLSVNSQKTEVVLFTELGKINEVVRSLRKEVKDLGVALHDKLMKKTYVENLVKNGMKTQCVHWQDLLSSSQNDLVAL